VREPERLASVLDDPSLARWNPWLVEVGAVSADARMNAFAIADGVRRQMRRVPGGCGYPPLPPRPANIPDKDRDLLALMRRSRAGEKVSDLDRRQLRFAGAWIGSVQRVEAEAVSRCQLLLWAIECYVRAAEGTDLSTLRGLEEVSAYLREQYAIEAPPVPPEARSQPDWLRSRVARWDLVSVHLRFGRVIRRPRSFEEAGDELADLTDPEGDA
jgi:hypothetical protein